VSTVASDFDLLPCGRRNLEVQSAIGERIAHRPAWDAAQCTGCINQVLQVLQVLTLRTRDLCEGCAKIALTENGRSGGGEGRAGGDAAQFEHAMTDVAIFRQMSGGNGFSTAGHHLVERVAIAELRVKVPAEFTRPAGSRRFEAADDGMVDVIHEELLGDGANEVARFMRPSHIHSTSAGFTVCFELPLYYTGQDRHKPLLTAANFPVFLLTGVLA